MFPIKNLAQFLKRTKLGIIYYKIKVPEKKWENTNQCMHEGHLKIPDIFNCLFVYILIHSLVSERGREIHHTDLFIIMSHKISTSFHMNGKKSLIRNLRRF